MRAMKDSGLPWIRQIPQIWTALRGKHVLSLLQRETDENEGVVTCFRNGEVTLRSNRREEGFTFADKEIGYQGIRKGDLVIHGMDGFAGAIGISDSNGKGSPVLCVCCSKNDNDTKYLMYYLRMLASQNVFIALATGIRERSCDLRWNKVAELAFPIPPIAEQRKIAGFLDNESEKVDRIIARQKAAIEKLKEYKQSFITEAVTKGLDPNVPMKDSGIEWISKYPTHWCISKIGRVASTCSGATPNRDKHDDYFDNADVKWVRTLDLNDWRVWETSEYITHQAISETNCSLMPTGTVMVAMYGGEGTIGKCGILMAEATTNQAVCSIICSSQVFPMYLLYTLLAIRKYWMKYAVGTRKDPNISQEIVSSGKICIPSFNEQMTITAYLEEKCQSVNEAISYKESLIDRLETYKKSLIYEAVTGKLEV